jgi:hypothetical protein
MTTSGAVMTDQASELMGQIARLAPTKRHRLAPAMVNGTRALSLEQARMVLTHLRKCDDMPGAARLQAAEVSATVATRQYPQETPQDDAQEGRPQERSQERSQARPQLPALRAFTGIPAGYYATVSRTGTNDLDFWRVRKGTKGDWAGTSFAERVLGGGEGAGKPRTVGLDNIHQRLALQAIEEAGVDEAKKVFADNMGHCSDCGLPLTDEVSRRFGKGPTCREKRG